MSIPSEKRIRYEMLLFWVALFFLLLSCSSIVGNEKVVVKKSFLIAFIASYLPHIIFYHKMGNWKIRLAVFIVSFTLLWPATFLFLKSNLNRDLTQQASYFLKPKDWPQECKVTSGDWFNFRDTSVNISFNCRSSAIFNEYPEVDKNTFERNCFKITKNDSKYFLMSHENNAACIILNPKTLQGEAHFFHNS
jgi:hypothetical protein